MIVRRMFDHVYFYSKLDKIGRINSDYELGLTACYAKWVQSTGIKIKNHGKKRFKIVEEKLEQ